MGKNKKRRSDFGKSRISNNQKFLTKIKIGNENECWEWIGAKEKYGYGFFCEQRTPLKWKKAHVYSYEINKGEIKKGLCVCHSCDNPSCVNPNHLWLGTRAENNFDRIRKGRTSDRHGENNPRAKITWKQRDEIENLVKSGMTQTDVAKMFGIAQPNISEIMLGKSWKR